jgi:DNA-binding transcriptional MerR regulator
MAGDGLKVGELARLTGLSVRTLHHYDDIGLLSPSRRTPSGHRLYGSDEISRLQRIVSLRQLGLSLEDIRQALERPALSLERVLLLQIGRTREEIDRQRRLLALLEGLHLRLASSGQVPLEDLTGAIQGTLYHGRHFTPEQLEYLAERGQEVGQDRVLESEREWRALFEAYGEAMERGLDVESEEVQALASRSTALVEEFTGGDDGVRSALSRMYATDGGDVVMRRFGIDLPRGLWEYMRKASACFRDREVKRGPEVS